jgi:hypothetical protein
MPISNSDEGSGSRNTGMPRVLMKRDLPAMNWGFSAVLTAVVPEVMDATNVSYGVLTDTLVLTELAYRLLF